MSAGGPPKDPWRGVTGLALGLLATVLLLASGLTPRHLQWPAAGALVLAGLLAGYGPVWWLRCTATAAAAGALTLLVVLTTPLPPTLFRNLVVDDGVRRADVLVVLSAGAVAGRLSAGSAERLLSALQLMDAGAAPVLVFTGDPYRGADSFAVEARRQMEAMGLSTAAVVPFEPVPRMPVNTRGEALSLAAMAQRHGWRSVLLVTSPSHTRRSRAVFRAAGLTAFVVPSAETEYDYLSPTSPTERLAIFRDWLYESAAWLKYHRRGWL